jgi:hypothetical protein
MKNAVFWDVATYRSCVNRRFGGGTCVQSAATWSRWFLARALFYPEDGGDTFLRNVGSHKIYSATSQKTIFFIQLLVCNIKEEINSMVLWVTSPCTLLGGYNRFGGTYLLHLHIWLWRQYVPPKRWYAYTTLHGIITQNTALWISTCERTSRDIREGSCSDSVVHFIHFCRFLLRVDEYFGPKGTNSIDGYTQYGIPKIFPEYRMILNYCRGSRGL